MSNAVPDRSTHKSPYAYTGLFQKRKNRIELPVKCFYVNVGNHHFLIDAGWSKAVATHPIKHLGFGLFFASEPVMKEEEAAINQLSGKTIDAILMTHLDCDHISGLSDFTNIPVYTSSEEMNYSRKEKIRYGKLVRAKKFIYYDFGSDENAPFGKSADVFGDKSVIAYLTPTHSAGSVIYKINDENCFALVVGDNGYSEKSWKKGLLPGPIYNRENMQKCLRWIDNEIKSPNCLGAYCAHDPIDR